MKRSEMILLIADELEEMYDSWNSGGYTVFESRAKRLLQKIEDAGMTFQEESESENET